MPGMVCLWPAFHGDTFSRSKSPENYMVKSVTRAVAIALVIALGLGPRAAAQTTAATWSPELSLTVKRVSAVRVSPAGDRVAFVVAIPIMEGDRSYWSYGGYMTSWIITQTNRFKAASVGAGVTNLMSFAGTADIPSFIPDYFGGEYWEAFDLWRSRSPMFNMRGVNTPTLIQHGEADVRVPVSQGYELYNALKRQRVPVKMIVYPRQPHGLQEPRHILDAARQNLEWFERWVPVSQTAAAMR